MVAFCDASAKYCTDIHVLGTAQLTNAGKAIMKFRPGIGSHSYKAVFAGTATDAGSSSSASSLAVTGQNATTTSIVLNGYPGSYSLTATVAGVSNMPGITAPTGTISFVDTNNGNAVMATAPVGSGTASLNFLNSSTSTLTQEANAVAVADFNGDGIPDLAVVNNGSILIFLGSGNGQFVAEASSLPTGMSAITVATGDFNNDGKADLAVVNDCGDAYPCSNDAGTVWVFLGNGDGTFDRVSGSLAAGPGSFGLAVGDFNADGAPDLAVTNYGGYSSNQLTVFLGKGDGSFNAGVFYSVPGSSSKTPVIADFNGDGIADVAVGEFWSGQFGFLQGNGDGTFVAGVPFGVNAPLGSGYIAAADFNGDGLPDLVIPSQDGRVPVVLSQPTETVTATANSVAPVGAGTHQVAAGYPGDSSYGSILSGTVALTAALEPLGGQHFCIGYLHDQRLCADHHDGRRHWHVKI